jgi:hypothetical protein
VAKERLGDLVRLPGGDASVVAEHEPMLIDGMTTPRSMRLTSAAGLPIAAIDRPG